MIDSIDFFYILYLEYFFALKMVSLTLPLPRAYEIIGSKPPAVYSENLNSNSNLFIKNFETICKKVK